MNIGEANDFFKVMRSLRSEASDADRQQGIEAAADLVERAHKALSAGPGPLEVAGLLGMAHEAVFVASIDEVTPVVVDLAPRPVKTAHPVGGVL